MSTPTVFLFSGQGSQHYQMGAELYREEPVFRAELDRLDAVVADLCGQSVVARMYGTQRAGEPFLDTLVTHPAIVMVELALAELLRSDGVEPDVLLGASLGEFTAAALSGVFGVEECLRLVVAQARVLEGLPEGGMLAVLADPGLHQRMPELREHTDLAARNGPQHFVVSGAEEALRVAEEALRVAEIPCQRVAVEHPYHSRLLDSRREACTKLMTGLALRPPRIPIVSCATGERMRHPSVEHYWSVVSGPIEFEKAVRGLEAEGPHRYVDLGPSGTLHNLASAVLGPARGRSYPVLSMFGHDRRLLSEVRATFAARPAPRAVPAPTVPRTIPAPTAPRAVPAPEVSSTASGPAGKGVPMKVYGFPGQGSQSQGMGAELFDRYPGHVATADAVLGYSIRELCERNPEGRLRRTEYTQPALFVVSALSYLARCEEDPVPPDYLVGHSLGEYAALFAAGVFDFETGLRLVARRGELMGRVATGSMAAVVGCDLATVESMIAGIDGVSVANINAFDQVVLAGQDSGLDAVGPLVEAAGGRYGRLRVSGALHSPFVTPAAGEFGRFLETVPLAAPRIPVLANLDASPHDAEGLRHRLTRQIDSPVRWLDSVLYLLERGEIEFVELGPGKVLRNLVAKITKQWAQRRGSEAEEATPSRVTAPASSAGGVAGLERGDVVNAGTAAATPVQATPAPPVDMAAVVAGTAPVATATTVAGAGQESRASATVTAATTATAATATTAAGLASASTVEGHGVVGRGATMSPQAPTLPDPAAVIAAGTELAGEYTALGSASFRDRYGLAHACVAGSMYGGVSGVELLSRLAKAGGMGFFGAGGLPMAEVEAGIGAIAAELGSDNPFGAALPYHPSDPARELALADLYLRLGVTVVEASGHLEITPGLVKFRLKGGSVLAKVSRTDIAEQMLSPAPAALVRLLREQGHLTAAEESRAATLPVARDVVVEAGSGWLSGPATLTTLLPSVLRLRDRLAGDGERVHVGAAGGIGTPEAAAAALHMGAEFLLTGSINQCTVEAATSARAKDILRSLSVHDIDVAPWPGMFELGAKNTVARKGLFYPARATKLHELWRAHDRYVDIDPAVRDQIERHYLRRSFAEVLAEIGPSGQSKQDMAEVFRTYLTSAFAFARDGVEDRKVDYHIPCGPAMGAFNDWVRGTELEPWQRRHVDSVTEHLLTATAALLDDRAARRAS